MPIFMKHAIQNIISPLISTKLVSEEQQIDNLYQNFQSVKVNPYERQMISIPLFLFVCCRGCELICKIKCVIIEILVIKFVKSEIGPEKQQQIDCFQICRRPNQPAHQNTLFLIMMMLRFKLNNLLMNIGKAGQRLAFIPFCWLKPLHAMISKYFNSKLLIQINYSFLFQNSRKNYSKCYSLSVNSKSIMFFSTRLLPACILTIGCTALAFQATVLHPFHDKLDEDFHQIKEMEMQDQRLQIFEEQALEAVNHVGSRVDELLRLKAQNLIHSTFHWHH